MKKLRAISMTSPLMSLRHPDIAQKYVAILLTVVTLLVLGWVLSYWTWVWFSPRPEARVPALSGSTGHSDSANNLFGQVVQRSAPVVGGTINLVGVIAAAGIEPGYAMLSFSGQPVRPVKEGAEVAAGIKLSAVRPDEIDIERGGAKETIVLPKKGNTAMATPVPR